MCHKLPRVKFIKFLQRLSIKIDLEVRLFYLLKISFGGHKYFF